MNAAVLVIDVQHVLRAGEYEVSDAGGVIDRINEVIRTARAAGRNHLVDFLVACATDLSHGRAPMRPPTIEPGRSAAAVPSAQVIPLEERVA